MDDGEKQSLERIRTLVEASEEVRFHSQDRGELFKWVNWTSRQQDYGRLKRSGKGLVRRYIAKLTGLSRAQTARLIRCHQGGSQVKPRAYQRHRLRNVPPPSRGLSTYPAQAGSDRENGANPIRKDVLDICAWIRYIKGIWMESKVWFTSTRWMK